MTETVQEIALMTLKNKRKKKYNMFNRFGEITDRIVNKIEKRLRELGYHFIGVYPRGLKLKNENDKIIADIDMLLEEMETSVLVKITKNPVLEDITEHIERINIFRVIRTKSKRPPNKVLGGIAGPVFDNVIKKAIWDAGLYVIEQSGDTMKIDMPEGWEPKAW
jgi:hypothetical protein